MLKKRNGWHLSSASSAPILEREDTVDDSHQACPSALHTIQRVAASSSLQNLIIILESKIDAV